MSNHTQFSSKSQNHGYIRVLRYVTGAKYHTSLIIQASLLYNTYMYNTYMYNTYMYTHTYTHIHIHTYCSIGTHHMYKTFELTACTNH